MVRGATSIRRETATVSTSGTTVGISTVDGLRTEAEGRRPKRFWLHAASTAALSLLIGLAVLDGVGLVDLFGVDTTRVRASGGGYDLEVRYGTVSRPALATPFEIVVTRPRGFDRPIKVAVSSSYLAMWDENGVVPSPAAETSAGRWVVWEFDPPLGDVLTVVYDGRIEPSAQSGRDGMVAVLEDDEPVVQVHFHTAVRP